jgi:hypothetical protein
MTGLFVEPCFDARAPSRAINIAQTCALVVVALSVLLESKTRVVEAQSAVEGLFILSPLVRTIRLGQYAVSSGRTGSCLADGVRVNGNSGLVAISNAILADIRPSRGETTQYVRWGP